MKKLALIFVTIAALIAGSSSVFAATSQSTTKSTASSETANDPKDFQAHKDRILKHIGERMEKMQKIQSCVQAANDFQAMKACKPHWHHHHDKDHEG